MLGNLLSGFIIIVVGVNLMPSIADQVYAARYANTSGVPSNVTGAASTIVGLVPLFFSLGVMSAGVALAMNGLKNAGIM